MTIAPGTRLDPYGVGAKLGEGGMGEVWRATDPRLEREVALEVLPASFTADPERLARFEREARLLAQLHHPTWRGSPSRTRSRRRRRPPRAPRPSPAGARGQGLSLPNYDVTAGGEFVMLRRLPSGGRLHVVLVWSSELRRLLAAGGSEP